MALNCQYAVYFTLTVHLNSDYLAVAVLNSHMQLVANILDSVVSVHLISKLLIN